MRPMETTTAGFGWIDWGVLAAYMAGMVWIGAAVSRRQEDTETYFLGGRSMPGWAVSLSVLATSLSAATFVGAPQIGYTGNLTYLSLSLGGVLGALIVAYLFVPPIYQAGTTTIYGYLGKRFGEPSMVAASLMFLFGRLLASGARLFMAGIGFALILYGGTDTGELAFAVLVLGVVGTLYTACGGVRAVIWTDTVQIGVVLLAAGISLVILMRAIPLSGVEIVAALRMSAAGDKLQVIDRAWAFDKPYTLWAALIANTVVSVACYGVDHDLAQRMMTARSPLHGGMALIWSTVIGLPVAALFLGIGLLLHIFYTRPDLMGAAAPGYLIEDSKSIYPQFLLHHLPAGLRGLSMAGLFAAAMSSVDSAINAMAATAVADVYVPFHRWRRRAARSGGEEVSEAEEPPSLALSRTAVVIMGVLLTVFAVGAIYAQDAGGQGLIDFALGVMAFALAPLLGVFCTALFTRRGNTASVYAALWTGMAAVLLLQPYMAPKWFDFKLAWPWVWVVAAPLSFLVCVSGRPAQPSA